MSQESETPTSSLVTNREFAKGDKLFRTACELAEIPPTKRQASKWRNQQGIAYKQFRHKASAKVNKTNGQD